MKWGGRGKEDIRTKNPKTFEVRWGRWRPSVSKNPRPRPRIRPRRRSGVVNGRRAIDHYGRSVVVVRVAGGRGGAIHRRRGVFKLETLSRWRLRVRHVFVGKTEGTRRDRGQDMTNRSIGDVRRPARALDRNTCTYVRFRSAVACDGRRFPEMLLLIIYYFVSHVPVASRTNK